MIFTESIVLKDLFWALILLVLSFSQLFWTLLADCVVLGSAIARSVADRRLFVFKLPYGYRGMRANEATLDG